MENKQQTAVEWLEATLKEKLKHIIINNDSALIESVFNQALQMEREQIEQAYKSDRYPCSYEDAEQYYEDTYGK